MTAQKQLGRYEIVGELGKGAMGLVYLAKDPLIGRELALKTFRVGLSSQDQEMEQFRARFLREAQSAGILNHSNIVTIHDVVVDPAGDFFIAMEYVKGTDLKRLMQTQGRLDLKFVLDIVAQIADGLDYAHSKGVVHRDIKPANIILTEDKQAKITDFGIARIDASNLTTEGQLLGTPNYMAPEQIQGKEVDHRADIFSLGVMFYELVTGKKPFQGENLTQVTHRIVFDPFPDPKRFVPGLPDSLVRVMSRALAKEPEERYQRAAEIGRELRAVLNPPKPSHSVIGSSGSFLGGGEESGTSELHNMTMTSAAAHEALKPPTTAAIPTLRASSGTTAVPAPPPNAGPSVPRWTILVGALVAMLAVAVIVVVIFDRQPPAQQVTRVDPEAELAARYQPHVDAGHQHLEAGDVDGALLEIEKALAIAPGNRSIRQLKTRAERLATDLAGDDPEQARVDYLLESARSASAQRDYRKAIRQAEAALALDADSTAGKTILAEAQEGQQRKEQVRDRFNKPAVTAPGTATGTRSPAVTTAPTVALETTVHVAFQAELAEGRITIFAGPDRILQENFRFGRDGGQLPPASFTLPSGSMKFNIYTRPKGGQTRTTELEAELPANGQATLSILLLDDSRVRVSVQ